VVFLKFSLNIRKRMAYRAYVISAVSKSQQVIENCFSLRIKLWEQVEFYPYMAFVSDLQAVLECST
jgi:hypothetical protein